MVDTSRRTRAWLAMATVLLMAAAFTLLAAQPAHAATAAEFASSWSVNNNADWTPFPPDPAPLGAPDNFCTGASTPTGSWAQFTFTGFGALSPGDTVTGIEVRVNYLAASGSNTVQLTNSGALTGSSKTVAAVTGQSFCSNTAWVGTGGAGDLWGTSLTEADFLAGNVGFRLTQDANTVDVDAVELIVHFTPGGNTAPTADAGGPYSVNEGASVTLDASGSSDAEDAPGDLTYEWDLDNDGTYDDATGITTNFSAAGLDGPGSATVGLRVTDTGGMSDTDTASVDIDNVAPALSGLAATATAENGSTTLSGTISDPGTPDTFTLTIDWGDPLSPGNNEVVNLPAGTTNFSVNHQYLDDNPTATPSDTYTISVTLADDDSGSDSDTTMVTVSNVAPTIDSLGITSPIDEDDTATLSGTYSDVGTLDSHELDVDWDGDGTFDETVAVSGGVFSVPHQYLDDDPTGTPGDTFPVNVRLRDDDTGADTDSVALTVDNVAPVSGGVASDATFDDKAEEGETVTIDGSFTDVGTQDTHTVSVDWGDGTVTSATVTQGAGSGTFTDGHAYTMGGVYTITVTITDDDTGSVTDSTTAVVTGAGVNGGVLQIVGTNEADRVHVKVVGDEIDVFATFLWPRHRRFALADIASIEIWLCDGNDRGIVHPNVGLDAVIHGGDGNDQLMGGSGNDVVEGENGNDRLWGRNGDDLLDGGEGNDRLDGGHGNDILIGGDGDDNLLGRGGDDDLDGGADTDRCRGGTGTDSIVNCEL